MPSEYDTLTGSELFTKRAESGDMTQKLEKFFGFSAMLLAVAAAAFCIVEGMKSHPQHIVMAVVIVIGMVQFYIIARLYLQDQLQERKVVYTSCLLLICLGAAGLVYATGWQACPVDNPWATCNGYLAKNGDCLKLTTPLASNPSHCYAITGTGADISGRAIFNVPFAGNVTCSTAATAAATCFAAPTPNFTCPSQKPMQLTEAYLAAKEKAESTVAKENADSTVAAPP